jgi:hypothetical protein
VSPGDRPERFSKAAASGADVVIIALEDAVAEDSKSKALATAVAVLTPNGEHGTAAVRALVRTNPAGSAAHDEEIHTLLSLAALTGHGLLGVVVPKAEDVALLHALARTLPNELAFVPLIESALGAVHALEIASIDAVTRLAFGAIDFALDIDADGGDRFSGSCPGAARLGVPGGWSSGAPGFTFRGDKGRRDDRGVRTDCAQLRLRRKAVHPSGPVGAGRRGIYADRSRDQVSGVRGRHRGRGCADRRTNGR